MKSGTGAVAGTICCANASYTHGFIPLRFAPRRAVVRSIGTCRAAISALATRRRAGRLAAWALIITPRRRRPRRRRPWRRRARRRRARRRRPSRRRTAVIAATAAAWRAALAAWAVASPPARAVAAPAAAVEATVTIAIAVAPTAAGVPTRVPARWRAGASAAARRRVALAAQHLARRLAIVARPLHLERAAAKGLAVQLILCVFGIANLVKLYEPKALEAPAREKSALILLQWPGARHRKTGGC